MNIYKRIYGIFLVVISVLFMNAPLMAEDAFSPYGTSKKNLHDYPKINAVFDANYTDPKSLNILYAFVKNTMKPLKGKMVVVTHGPELRAFAKENYVKYQGIMDKMKQLADAGVEFRMCHNALRAAGFKADDFHGFVTVVPAGFPEIAYLQDKGYRYINPLPYGVRDVRYLDQPKLKK
ncbi:MAG: DsrE family protein [Gammaproteobacteria bacterium]|nr:DsrE family protein [Gammaproteobacteria bacterium]